MLEAIKAFFRSEMEPEPAENQAPDESQRMRVAACALLLELAHADKEFTDAEREHIEGVLERQFAVRGDAARELIVLAERERRDAVDLFQFTSLIARSYDASQKMVLAEVMWGLVHADGVVAKHETYLMRKISQLLELAPGFLAEARKRAADRAGPT